MNSVSTSQTASVLNSLHKDAQKDFLYMLGGLAKSINRPVQPQDFKNAYLPISKDQGEAIRKIIIENNCQQVIEFGTSFGISTIYLADAVKQTGGKVISTELIDSKAKRANQNILNAGLETYVEIKVGDAMQTLKDIDVSIDFLLLDGWKDLYLPLFKMLETKFHPGTLIYADNMDMADTKPYADYLHLNKLKYSTIGTENGKAFLTTVR